MTERRAVFSSLLGKIEAVARDGALTALRLRAEGSGPPPRGELLIEVARQVREYFEGTRRAFSLPLERPAACTTFQRRVWDALIQIPFGETRTYGDLARELGTSPRAVGGACGRNPLPLLVPCHRVVAKNGLGGFGGDWETGLAVEVKAALLDHERRIRAARVGG